MKIIEISVDNHDVSRLKDYLAKLEFVTFVKEKKPVSIDPITHLSEESLAEEWDSEEDSRYEKYVEK